MREIRSYMPLENERASFAYNEVKNLYNRMQETQKKEFKSWSQKFPSMIINCGLIQTVSYYEDNKGKEICNILEKWLKKKNYINKNDKLLSALVNINDPKKLRLITLETIKFSTWVKRFASIFYEEFK
jgi:CRISPR type III-B/RAMP module-associated protein Cmr5